MIKGSYNALKFGTSAEVADRVMTVLADADDGGFSEPHHRTVGERWLHLAVMVMDALVAEGVERPRRWLWRRDIACLAELMQPVTLFTAAGKLPTASEARQRAEDRHAQFSDPQAGDLKNRSTAWLSGSR